MMKKFRKGQTMVEYILIVCLIAIALIGVFQLLSGKIGEKAKDASEKIEAIGN